MVVKELLLTDLKENYRKVSPLFSEQVLAYAKRGGRLYGPHQRASDPGADTRLEIEPRSELDGELNILEAITLLVLHNEIRQLYSEFQKGGEVLPRVEELLDLSEGDMVPEVIEGMASFCHLFGKVAFVRKLVVEGRMPTGTTVAQRNLRYWYDLFAQKIIDDGFMLSCCVCGEMIEVVEDLTTWGVVGEKLETKIKSRRKGAELAAGLYLRLLNSDSD